MFVIMILGGIVACVCIILLIQRRKISNNNERTERILSNSMPEELDERETNLDKL